MLNLLLKLFSLRVHTHALDIETRFVKTLFRRTSGAHNIEGGYPDVHRSKVLVTLPSHRAPDLVWRRSILDDFEWEHVGINTRKSNPNQENKVITPTEQRVM